MRILFFTISLFIMLFAKGQSQDMTWPRQLNSEGSVITMYQPQVQSWDQFKKLDLHLAFSLVPNQGKEVLGVLYMVANSEVNMDNHQVVITNPTVTKVNFPSGDTETSDKLEKIVRSFYSSDRTLIVSVEQIVAFTPKETPSATVKVNNDPPVIFVSNRPTLLLQLEGVPKIASTGKDDIEFVINANYPLFFEKSSRTWFLYDGLE